MSQKIKKQAYWTEQNAQWESSGLTQQQFCEERGLVYREFVYWRGNLNKFSPEKAKPKLLKVSTSATPTVGHFIADVTSCLEVILPTGIKLHIKTEADISKANVLIKLLGEAS